MENINPVGGIVKVCKSHVKIYEYLRGLSTYISKKGLDIITIEYHQIEKATGLSYPIVCKVMPQLVKLGCIKKLQDGRGRTGQDGSKYLIDVGYEAVKSKVKKERVYRIKYKVTVWELIPLRPNVATEDKKK